MTASCKSSASHSGANREGCFSTELSRSRPGLRTAGVGHEDQFPLCRLNARCVIRKETFAGARGNDEDAPIVLKNSKIGPHKKRAKLKFDGTSPLDTTSVLLRTPHAA
jgi:hypothetical protein